LRVYVSGPLTNGHHPEQLKCFYEELACLCEARGMEAYLPHQHTDPVKNGAISPKEVFSRDVHEIEGSDLLLVYAGVPSHGVGGEVVYAGTVGVEAILIHERDAKVSRFLLGSAAVVDTVVIESLEAAQGPVGAALDKWLARKRAGRQAREVASVLTDPMIHRRLLSRELRIVDSSTGKDVFTTDERARLVELEEGQIDAHGYKLRAGDLYSWRIGGWADLKKSRYYDLRPGESVIISTREYLALPLDVVGTVHSLARLTLAGCSHTSTSIHPGWGTGQGGAAPLCVEIHNVGLSRLRITYGERFCRVVFFQAAEEAAIRAPTFEEVTADFMTAAKMRQDRLNTRRRQWTTTVVFAGLASAGGFFAVYVFIDLAAAVTGIASVFVALGIGWAFSERVRLGFRSRANDEPSH